MKHLLSFLFICSGIYGFSQPVITSGVMTPSPGDSIVYYSETVMAFDPGPGGEGVSWDFSGINGDENLTTMFYADADHCGNFSIWENVDWDEFVGPVPEWWGESSWHTSERWFNADESSFSFCRISGLEFEMNFNEPFTEIIFPLTFGTENTSVYTGWCFYGFGTEDTFPFTGSSVLVADGYGTLTLATGTYPDVLRVKVVDSIGCDHGRIDSYYWFKEGITGPLFKYAKNYNWGFEYVFVRLDGPEYLGVDETQLKTSIYPNPAGDYLMINGIESAVAEIYNVNGQFILSQQISNEHTSIDTRLFEKGVYIIKLKGNDFVRTQVFEKM